MMTSDRFSAGIDRGQGPDLGAYPAEDAAGFGELNLRSKPPGAQVVLCGRPTPWVTPTKVQAELGKSCILELALEGFAPYQVTVTPQKNNPITIVATLRRSRPDAGTSSSWGKLEVISNEPRIIYLNDKVVGVTPQLMLNLLPGAYDVEARLPTGEGQSQQRKIRIRAGQTTTVHFDSRPEP